VSDRPRQLVLIDGYAQFFRAYHAIRAGLKSPITNEPTNLVFGFVAAILKLLREERPTHLAVVLDVSGDRGTFRSRIYPEYKANRPPPPSDFAPQVERCLELLRLFGIPIVGSEGNEADDVIATIVRRLRREDPELEIRIASRDKDLAQLVDERTRLYDIHTGETLGVEELFERKGVGPHQVVDILALMGDTSDNIPGVPGIGPKTAAELIERYGSLDELLLHVGEIKGKRGEAIAAHRDTIDLARRLVVLKDDCPIRFELDDAIVDGRRIDLARLLERMRELGFNRHREDLKAIAAELGIATPGGGQRSATASDDAAGTLFASDWAAGPGPREPGGAYRGLLDAASVEAFLREARSAPIVAVDVETDSLVAHEALIAGVSMSIAEGTGVYIPLRSADQATHCSAEEGVRLLKPFLEDPSVRKVGHNLKFDINALRNAGVLLAGIVGDSMVESYLVDATRSSHGLDALAEHLLGHRTIPIEEVIGSGASQRPFTEAPLKRAVPYAAEDADIALRLHRRLEPQWRHGKLAPLHDEVEIPLVSVLADLEWNGIRVDAAELVRQRARLEERIAALRREISDLAPIPFNPDSPKQLATVLFNAPTDEPPGLGLTPVRKTKTGYSTDAEVLETLAEDPDVAHPLPAKIVEYRQLTKLVGTYLVALAAAISPRSGRVHARFHQTVTATGRLSSSEPNLQNIPIRTDVGRDIRRAFVAEPGHLLVAADYSQIELRMLAHLSGDPALIAAFRAGADIHRTVAAEVFGVPPDRVDDHMRTVAKMVNFGIVYGITAFGLARRLGGGVSRERAQAIIDDYRRRFAGIGAFLEECKDAARRQGFVETILGRRRPVPQIDSRSPAERALGERIAINTVVQGSAADLIKVAMVRLRRELAARSPRTRMLLQIHDELVFEVPEAEVDAVTSIVVEVMQHAMELSVPLLVSHGSGRSWHDC
jgi:DNA polymerase-1